MDNSIFTLLYSPKNPVTGVYEPDKSADLNLAFTVSEINRLLFDHKGLLAHFQPFRDLVPKGALVNDPLSTVIDVLILFCHLPPDSRHKLYGSLIELKNDTAKDLARVLERFSDDFLKAPRAINREELHGGRFNKKHVETSVLTAKRFIPFLTLAVAAHRVEFYPLITEPQEGHLTAKEQVSAINKMADKKKGYYEWTLAPFIQLSDDTEAELDKLPRHQFRFTQITQLLDNLSEIVHSYRHFLQHEVFQIFLKNCLDRMKAEFRSLQSHLAKVDNLLKKDPKMNRGLQGILVAMNRHLTESLKEFEVAIANAERVVSAPNFTERQKRELVEKLGMLNAQFSELFGQPSGVAQFLTMNACDSPPSPGSSIANSSPANSSPVGHGLSKSNLSGMALAASDTIGAKKIIALRNLVHHCYDALSSSSKPSAKGAWIKALLTKVERSEGFTDEQVKNIVLDLVRLTASYRKTWFAEARYGETRSAKALIAAVKDPNQVLPLAAIIFGKHINPAKLTDAQIIERFNTLRKNNHWEASSQSIQAIGVH